MSDKEDEQARAQRAAPMLSYEDVGAAIEWLERAFGFRERADQRYTDDEGRVTHAELDLDGAMVMLGWPGPEYRSPKRHAEECEQAPVALIQFRSANAIVPAGGRRQWSMCIDRL